MLWFVYEALDGDAKEVTDIMLADNQKDATSKIRERGQFPTRVRQIGKKEVQENTDLLSYWRCNQSKQVPLDTTYFDKKTAISYVEYLTEKLGNALIKWGEILKG